MFHQGYTVGVKKKATMAQVKLSVPHDKFWFKKWKLMFQTHECVFT